MPTCHRCGDDSNDEGFQAICCLWAPKAKQDAECAWCGNDLPSDHRRDGSTVKQVRVFCNKRCSQEYQDDFTQGDMSPFGLLSMGVPSQPRCDR